MITEFGKILRKIRIEVGDRLYDMAKKLDVSSSFLSSVETGKKSIPSQLEEKIIIRYKLPTAIANSLRLASYHNRDIFTITAPSNHFSKEVIGMFTRMVGQLSDEELKQIELLMKSLKAS